MKSTTLDQWESELKEFLRLAGPKSFASEDGRRILALIDLVRKKDEALKDFLKIKDQPWNPEQYLHEYINETLALTEELK